MTDVEEVDEPRDYAALIALSMPEEAVVAASALRADGVDAFVGNATHANNDWNTTVALGGLQVLVPRSRLADAKDALRERIRIARENQDGEPTRRRDHCKVCLVIARTLLTPLALVA